MADTAASGNLGWRKYPPKGFSDKGVDVIGELDAIKDALADNEYNASYDLMNDIQAVGVKAHDYHLQLRPQIGSLITGWVRGDGSASAGAFAMVSVSKDGKELPKLYDYCKLGSLECIKQVKLTVGR